MLEILNPVAGQVLIGRLIEPEEVASFVGDLHHIEALPERFSLFMDVCVSVQMASCQNYFAHTL